MSGFVGKGVVIAGGGRQIGMVRARLIAKRGRSVSLIGKGPELHRGAMETLQNRGE